MAQRRFDYKAAKASGVSDEDIAAYLDQKNASGDSLYIDRRDLPKPDSTASTLTGMQQTAKNYLDTLPWVGGGIGGAGGAALMGGTTAGLGAVPGAIMGAGVGGAAGEGLRGLGYQAFGIPQPQHPGWENQPRAMQALGGMANQGNQQMLWQTLGEAPAALVAAGAKPVMQAALRPSAAMKNQFKNIDLAQKALDEGIGTPAQAEAKRVASAAKTAALTNASNGRWDAYSFVNHPIIAKLYQDLKKSTDLPESSLNEARDYIGRWWSENVGKKSASEWHKAAQALQQSVGQGGTSAYVKQQSKGIAGQLAASPIEDKARQALAAAIKERLGSAIPGLKAQDAETQAMIGVRNVMGASSKPPWAAQVASPIIADILARATGRGGFGEIPAVMGGLAAVHAAYDPRVLAHLALGMNSPVTGDVLRQTPRYLGAQFQNLQGGR